jgi:hypothetical protein
MTHSPFFRPKIPKSPLQTCNSAFAENFNGFGRQICKLAKENDRAAMGNYVLAREIARMRIDHFPASGVKSIPQGGTNQLVTTPSDEILQRGAGSHEAKPIGGYPDSIWRTAPTTE